jgi:Lamin Tail Domain
MPLHSRPSTALGLSLLVSALLAACGGGSGGEPAGAGSLAQHGATVTAAPTQHVQAAASASGGGVMISEVMAGSWKGAADEDAEVQDWVELYNPAARPVDLRGYGLSNKAASPFLWAFPAGTQIAPKGYLRVWLSKKDRAVSGKPLHANFNLDSGDDAVSLTASNGTAAGIAVDSATRLWPATRLHPARPTRGRPGR